MPNTPMLEFLNSFHVDLSLASPSEELAAEHGSLHGDETVSNGEDTGEAGEGDAQGSAQTPTPAGRDTDSATAWDTDLEIDGRFCATHFQGQ